MSDAYSSFASVYDSFMDEIPYSEWADFICDILKKQDMTSGLVCDLGCGTGRLTRELRDRGYDMIGIDLSPDMLEIAREAEENLKETGAKDSPEADVGPESDVSAGKSSEGEILYLCQDMREFELYGTVGAIVSACDCVNYITDPSDLLEVFRLANNYLESRGSFIFDFHTDYYYADILGCNNFADNREEAAIIWENWYDEEERSNEYNITIFSKLPNGDFRRYEETHLQRAYSAEEIASLLEAAGLELVGMYDSYTKNRAKKHSERITVVAREKYQAGKHYESH